jgi:hypothetical protein
MLMPISLDDLDLSLLTLIAGLAMSEEVERRIAEAGLPTRASRTASSSSTSCASR